MINAEAAAILALVGLVTLPIPGVVASDASFMTKEPEFSVPITIDLAEVHRMALAQLSTRLASINETNVHCGKAKQSGVRVMFLPNVVQ